MKRGKKRFVFSNRLLYTFIFLGILAIFAVGVYATTYTASGTGHPYTEISTCSANQILKMNSAGTTWACGTDIDTDTNTWPTKKDIFDALDKNLVFVVSNYCNGAGLLSLSNTCTTTSCDLGGDMGNGYYTCSGSCGYNQKTCSNLIAGYLIYYTPPVVGDPIPR